MTHRNGERSPADRPQPSPAQLVSWIRWRAAVPHLHRGHVKNQRRSSLILLVFGVARIIVWTILGICVAFGLLHLGGFAWAKILSESIPFVAMISIYANWATDVDAATAAFAALVAADSHVASDTNRQLLTKDFASVEDDIARLAAMSPCPAADELAASIRARLGDTGGQYSADAAAQAAEQVRQANAVAEIATAQAQNAPGGGDPQG